MSHWKICELSYSFQEELTDLIIFKVEKDFTCFLSEKSKLCELQGVVIFTVFRYLMLCGVACTRLQSLKVVIAPRFPFRSLQLSNEYLT